MLSRKSLIGLTAILMITLTTFLLLNAGNVTAKQPAGAEEDGNVVEDTFAYLPCVSRLWPYARWAISFVASDMDEIVAVVETGEGDFVVAGNSEDAAYPGRIVKLDPSGNVIWFKNYQVGPLSDLQVTKDGDLIVAGDANVSRGADPPYPILGDWVVFRLRPDGSLVWARSIENTYWIYGLDQTNDGGFTVAGYRGWVGPWTLKLNGDGSVAWQRNHGGSDGTIPYSIYGTVDGGSIIAGTYSDFDYGLILKLNQDGTIAWQKYYEGTYSDSEGDSFLTINSTKDGGYITAGHREYDGWVAKVNADGEVVWQKSYAIPPFTTYSHAGPFTSIHELGDGGYIAAGGYGYLTRLDEDGNILWHKRYEGGRFDDLILANSGGFVAAGTMDTGGVWLLRLDENGKINDDCLIGEAMDLQSTVVDNPVANANRPATPISYNTAWSQVGFITGQLEITRICHEWGPIVSSNQLP